jgi:hypothetical protein
MPIDIKLFNVGSTIGYWDFIRDVPLFKVVEKVDGRNWKDRLEEEFEKLKYLKSLSQKSMTFDKIEQDPLNKRIFNCEGLFSGKRIRFNIRLPMRYPKAMPIAENFYIGSWYVGVDKFRAPCFGRMASKWREDGRMGLVHFLVMLYHYTAMAIYSIETPKTTKSVKKKKVKQKRLG